MSAPGGASRRQARSLLLVVLSAYLLLALGYSVVNPLFEAPDEHSHYFTAQTIAERGELPVAGDEPDPWMEQEAAQPPLYYVLGALLIAPLDTQDARDLVWRNPFVRLGDASWPVNINAFVHGPVEDWPWQGYVLAAHLLRAMSALFGLGTLACIYASGRLLWPSAPQKALLATALVAFLPQFGFLNGSISNDSLMAFLSAAALVQLLWMWLNRASRGRLLCLGITVGLAALTKTAGLLLLLYAVGVLILQAVRDRRWRLLLETAALVVAPVLLIAGWLWWRNWTLYGDITAANQFIGIAGEDRAYTIREVLGESSGLWTSLFAVFGWFNLRAPSWVYLIWNGLISLAVLGTVLALRRRPASRPAWREWLHHPVSAAAVLGLWPLLLYAGLVAFMLRTPAAQGRLLFPALIPLALAFAHGLDRYRRTWVLVLASLLTLATSVYALLFVVRTAYARPSTTTLEELPADVARMDTDMGQGLQLVAARLHTDQARPGDWVWLTLYWQTQTVPDPAPEFVLAAFGREGALVGKLQSYHGGGLYPASLWPPGKVVADRTAVALVPEMASPTQVALNLSIVGEPVSLDVATLKVVPTAWPAATERVLAQVGEGIGLAAAKLEPATARPGETVSVILRWQVTAAPGNDLTTFVHLGDSSETPLAQADNPPLHGDYPTGLWAAGEIIADEYWLPIPHDLPEERYPVWVGLYDRETMTRLPLSVDGARQPNDAYLVGWIRVGP